MSTSDLQKLSWEKKDDVLDLLKQALGTIGLGEFDVGSIRLNIKKRGTLCPNGEEPVWEATQNPDGTVTFHWVCK